ncbi:RraA family protein [Aspergillus foveolatus]|uniref:RraA family protein n=1 Tax=Aspergillus foveolatus TaxID=210207 RepID=UPI003CCD94E3
MGLSTDTMRALGKFASRDIGDALVRLGVPNCGYLSGLKLYSPGVMCTKIRIFGPAYTVRMVRDSDKAAPTPPQHFADAIPKDSVFFISQPKGLKLGAAGVVIDGRFRDLAEHQELGIGLFARDISILGSNTFTRSSNSDGGETVVIQPGDYIVGDADGVVAVPTDKVEECVELCQRRYNIDEETRACLENGEEMGPTIKRSRK